MSGNLYYPFKTVKETKQLRKGYEFSPFKKNYESNTLLNGKSLSKRQTTLDKARLNYPSKKLDLSKSLATNPPKQTIPTKKSDMVKKSKMYKYAQAASHALCKRAVSASADPVLQAIQNEVREKYIKSLKRTRDRSILQDLLLASAKGSLTGGSLGMIPGGLFGAATMPVRDRGTSIPLHDSLLRGGSTGLLSGLLIGGTLGAGANAVGALLTRDARKADAAAKLKALGVKD